MENFTWADVKEFADSFFSQTYSFDVQAVCHAPNHRIDHVTLEDACTIHWNSNGTVHAYGPITRGLFEGNPDIAGLGILIYFAVAPLISALGFAFVCWEISKRQIWKKHIKRYENDSRPPFVIHWVSGLYSPPTTRSRLVISLRTFLKAASDALTIITLSYVINFGLSGKCTLSGYHYIFGINAMLIAFASITMYVAMVRDYWSAVGAALLRTAAHVGIFAIVGRLLAYEWTGVTRVPDPFYTRDSDLYKNTDSSMFLPMACFLDQDLNPLTSLTTSQLDQVGVRPPVALAETWCFIFLSLCYVAAHAAHLFQFKHRYRKDEETLEEAEERAKEEMEGGSDRGCVILYWAAIVGVCMAVIIFCYWHLWILHLWMVKSGWMEDLPGSEQSEEEDLNGIGQLGYLCTLFWVLLLFLDEWRCCVRRRKD